jgi:hypothetical protein
MPTRPQWTSRAPNDKRLLLDRVSRTVVTEDSLSELLQHLNSTAAARRSLFRKSRQGSVWTGSHLVERQVVRFRASVVISLC